MKLIVGMLAASLAIVTVAPVCAEETAAQSMEEAKTLRQAAGRDAMKAADEAMSDISTCETELAA